METALFRFSSVEENKNKVYSTAIVSLFVSTLIFLLPVIFFSGSIANVLKYPGNHNYIVWVALIIGLDAFTSIPFAKLREQNKAFLFASLKFINIIVNIGLTVFFVWFCKKTHESPTSSFYNLVEKVYNPEIGVGYVFVANMLANAVSLILLLPQILKTKFEFDIALWKRMMWYALPVLIAGLAGMTNETMDRILLKYLLPADMAMTQVGIYGACYKISILMTIFIQTFRYAAEPFFFSHSAKEDAKILYAEVMNYFVIACSFIFLATMANIEWIQYFVGSSFRTGLPVVPILLLANLCLGIFFNLSIWYKLTGETKYGAYLTVFGAAITLLLNFFLIPRIGYMGSAWATLACYASMMLLSYIIGQKHYLIHYDLKRILGYLALSLTLYLSCRFFETESAFINLIFNNLLLLVFVIVVFSVEKLKSKSKLYRNTE